MISVSQLVVSIRYGNLSWCDIMILSFDISRSVKFLGEGLFRSRNGTTMQEMDVGIDEMCSKLGTTQAIF